MCRPPIDFRLGTGSHGPLGRNKLLDNLLKQGWEIVVRRSLTVSERAPRWPRARSGIDVKFVCIDAKIDIFVRASLPALVVYGGHLSKKIVQEALCAACPGQATALGRSPTFRDETLHSI